MGTTTTNYSLNKPTVGGDDDAWGGLNNTSMDLIDTQMKANADAVAATVIVANAALPKAGGALTGPVTTSSTIDGRDVAADGVTADAALPKAGGTMTGDTAHGDNVKAKFGAGDDLQIYHDGLNSYIDDAGTGALRIRAQDLLLADSVGNPFIAMTDLGTGGSVSLRHNTAEKLATTSTGVDVTGTVTADGLEVNSGTANTVATFKSTDAYALIKFEDSGTSTEMTMGAKDGDMVFRVDASEAMRIDSSGKVLINTLSTFGSANLNIGAVLSSAPAIALQPITDNYDSSIVAFKNFSGTNVGYIGISATATSYVTSSDYRLKEADVPMTGATERVKALRPINFAWKADGSRVDGFFAHELAEVVPEAATGTKDAMMDEEYEVSAATGDVFTAGSEAGFTEISPAIAASPAYYDVDGNVIKAEVVAVAAVHEAYEAVAEVIHSADVEKPETLEEGQQWRETTAQVMGTRSVMDAQGIDQSKLVPLLTATIQELIARIEVLESA